MVDEIEKMVRERVRKQQEENAQKKIEDAAHGVFKRDVQ
jgi:ribosomal protein L7/L12